MTRRDYILNTFANKLAGDYPQAGEGEDQSLLDAQETENAQNAPVSLKDKLLQRYSGAKQLAVANPTVSAAAGAGTLSALLAAVLSKKGKRLRNAAVGAGVGAGIGAGVVQGDKALKAYQQKKYTNDTVASILKKLGGKSPVGYSSLGTIPGVPTIKAEAKPGPYKE